VKYFFLTEGWLIGRVWELGGLWDELAHRRRPQIERLNLSIIENGERLWLHRTDPEVLMLEVKPGDMVPPTPIGQVMIKRLMGSDQVLDRLAESVDP
jgi:hypothetical protein